MDWREQNSVFEEVSAFGASRFNISGNGTPERINGASVSANFFRLMGTQPVLGRTFLDEEEKPGSGKVAVLSYAFWQRRFAGDSTVLGSTITLDNETHTIVGVAPAGFHFPRPNELPSFVGVSSQTDLWRPMGMSDDFINRKRANHQLCVIAKLKPRVTLAYAQAEMNALAARIEQSHPDSNQGIGIKVVPLNEQVVGNVRVGLLVLMGAVGLVLLIACANVANLFFARSTARQKEVAIRVALGASRWRIVRQFLTEALLLSLVSAFIGTVLSVWGVKAMLSLSRGSLPRGYEVDIDAIVLAFTIAVALLTTTISALAPSLQTSKINLTEALKEGSRGMHGAPRSTRVRGVLVVFEVALSLVLLIGAGLMIKSLATVLKIDPGFKTEKTISMNLALVGSRYPTAAKQISFFQDVNTRVKGLPGVETAGLISSVPLSGGVYAGGFSIEGRVAASESEDLVADRRMISPDYFDALGVPLIRGRVFSDQDNQTSQGVAIVSESLSRRFIPGEDPIGKRIKLGGRDSTRPWLVIVGVAGDVHDSALESVARPCIYVPYPQFPASSMTLVARAVSDPKLLISGIRNEVWAVDKDQPVTDIKTMDQFVADSISPRKFNALLLAIFAGLALILATVGIYGVIAYSVSQRVQEIGIRMALGAQQSNVIRLVLGRGMSLVFMGVAIGVGASLALTRVMTSLLFGVSATDFVTFLVVSGLLIGVALVASYIPARRAAKVDPMVALRSE
jgi:putative ABC transport system permease protein